jgi:hypothetical protein
MEDPFREGKLCFNRLLSLYSLQLQLLSYNSGNLILGDLIALSIHTVITVLIFTGNRGIDRDIHPHISIKSEENPVYPYFVRHVSTSIKMR